MAERLYIKEEGKEITWVEEEPFSAEKELQTLVAEHPDLLDGKQVSPNAPRRWMVVAPEMGIAVPPDTGNSLWVDLLIVDQDAIPTLVEVKLRSNTEINRTIIGQVLVYAAYATQTWTAAKLHQTFEDYSSSGKRDPRAELIQLLNESEPDVAGFWKDVATNLAAKNIRLLFVVDDIPDDLERAVEFLNAQMQRIEVLAVEIKQFRKGSTRTLVPRVIGRTAASSTRSTVRQSKLTRETFLDHFSDKDQQNTATRFLNHVEKLGCTLAYGTQTISIRTICSKWPPTRIVTLAYLHLPFGGTYYSGRGIEFTVSLNPEPSYPTELKVILDEWLGQLSSYEFAENVSTPKYSAWAFKYKAAFDQIGPLEARLDEIVKKLKAS